MQFVEIFCFDTSATDERIIARKWEHTLHHKLSEGIHNVVPLIREGTGQEHVPKSPRSQGDNERVVTDPKRTFQNQGELELWEDIIPRNHPEQLSNPTAHSAP